MHAQTPRKTECCAELGRSGRLTGSLRFPVTCKSNRDISACKLTSQFFTEPLYSEKQSQKRPDARTSTMAVRRCYHAAKRLQRRYRTPSVVNRHGDRGGFWLRPCSNARTRQDSVGVLFSRPVGKRTRQPDDECHF